MPLADRLEHSILGDTPLEFGDTGSSLVEGARYDPDPRLLRVTLKAGKLLKTYRYGGFEPSLWVEFYQADSKGSYFSRNIRPLYIGALEE